MNNEATQFKEGQSGNPNGRPKKGVSITDTIRQMMNEQPEIKKALGAKILDMALKGDITAIKTIWNYLDGMPQQSLKVEEISPNDEAMKMLKEIITTKRKAAKNDDRSGEPISN